MGKQFAAEFAGRLSDELHEYFVAAWESAAAKGQTPDNGDEYASMTVHVLFDALGAGVMVLNRERRDRSPFDVFADAIDTIIASLPHGIDCEHCIEIYRTKADELTGP